MHPTHVRKTEYVGFFVEPDLRQAIKAEAARRNIKISRLVRGMIQEQIAGAQRQAGPTLS